ncbi:hypothetical protein MHYP_G00216280 [Metynnis hypsauchen]
MTAPRKRKAKTEDASSSRPTKQLKLGETVANRKSVDQAVMNFVIQSLQPFSVVDQPSFQELLKDLQPNAPLMSRTTLQRRIDDAALDMKRNIKEAMSTVSVIATTTDCWSTRRRGFLGVTAHWLDPSPLERCSVALACRQLKGSHTFDVLGSALNEIHSEFGIQHKIVRTTTDNGSNFLKPFRMYGEQDENNNATVSDESEDDGEEMGDEDQHLEGEVDFVDVTAILNEDDGLQFQLPKHHRCACHLLNLVSTVDAEKATSHDAYKRLSRSTFSKCYALWNKCGRATTAAEMVEDVCKIQLIRPNATRWNSLLFAVERILRIVKDQGEGALRTLFTALKLPRLSSVEIAFLEEYARTMGPVSKALNILQGESDVQMGWLLPTLTLLITKLDKLRITSRYCKPLVDAVQEGLQHRFADMLVEPEFIAAAILVPKFKTSWTCMDYIKGHLEEDSAHLSPANGSSESDDEDFFASFKKSAGQEGVKQLEGYLASKIDHKDVLKSYPAVCKLSLKLNTALPASAACERLFSTAGLILASKKF